MHEYNGEFEVHVTVGLAEEGGWERFQAWCRLHQCKSVHIVLARGAQIDQPMATWRRSRTSLPAVLADARPVAAELQKAGFPVVRIKVEAATINQQIPRADEDARGHTASNDFEYHVKLLRGRSAPCDRLLKVCSEQHAHLSRNALRERSEEQEERFVTLRCHGVGKASSDRRLQQLLASLDAIGEQVIEVESEYCVYDFESGPGSRMARCGRAPRACF